MKYRVQRNFAAADFNIMQHIMNSDGSQMAKGYAQDVMNNYKTTGQTFKQAFADWQKAGNKGDMRAFIKTEQGSKLWEANRNIVKNVKANNLTWAQANGMNQKGLNKFGQTLGSKSAGAAANVGKIGTLGKVGIGASIATAGLLAGKALFGGNKD